MGVLQHRHRRQRAENPGELADAVDIGLPEERRLLRVEPAGQEIERDAAGVFPQQRRIVEGGQRVIIGDEIKGLAALLPLDGGTHHAEVIADVRDAGGLDAGEDAGHVAAGLSPSGSGARKGYFCGSA